MAITAAQVKELRLKTGAGMMDCKKALVENDGDMDAAIIFLQKKGMAAAEKKAGRAATEGLVSAWHAEAGHAASLVEVNCETDFVARNDQFQAFVEEVTTKVGESAAPDASAALQVVSDGKSVEQFVADTISTIGENIQLRRVARLAAEDGYVASYIHAGGQIGTLVSISYEGDLTDEKRDFARDVAMHVAAMNPGYLNETEIPSDAQAQQAEIFSARAAESGKPEKIIPRIVEGQLKKWRGEQVLLDQTFVKDGDVTVGQQQAQIGGVTVTAFSRLQVGEGLER